MNTHNIRTDFGRRKGELYTRLPLSYIKWLINDLDDDIAKAELKRRGSKLPKLELSRHAIDRASLHVLTIWSIDSLQNEGLATWLERVTLEAIAQGAQIGDRIHYKGMKFCIAKGKEFPVLKTIMRI